MKIRNKATVVKIYCSNCVEYKRYNPGYDDSISCSPVGLGKGDFYSPDSIIERDPRELNRNNNCRFYKEKE